MFFLEFLHHLLCLFCWYVQRFSAPASATDLVPVTTFVAENTNFDLLTFGLPLVALQSL